MKTVLCEILYAILWFAAGYQFGRAVTWWKSRRELQALRKLMNEDCE